MMTGSRITRARRNTAYSFHFPHAFNQSLFFFSLSIITKRTKAPIRKSLCSSKIDAIGTTTIFTIRERDKSSYLFAMPLIGPVLKCTVICHV